MRRHHYLYGRDRYLTDHAVLDELQALHRRIATSQARELGLLDPDGPGSWTHPDPSRMLHADGKVVTPLFKARPGEVRVDKTTGEVIPLSGPSLTEGCTSREPERRPGERNSSSWRSAPPMNGDGSSSTSSGCRSLAGRRPERWRASDGLRR
jgi:hypothetical protein